MDRTYLDVDEICLLCSLLSLGDCRKQLVDCLHQWRYCLIRLTVNRQWRCKYMEFSYTFVHFHGMWNYLRNDIASFDRCFVMSIFAVSIFDNFVLEIMLACLIRIAAIRKMAEAIYQSQNIRILFQRYFFLLALRSSATPSYRWQQIGSDESVDNWLEYFRSIRVSWISSDFHQSVRL